MFIGEVSRLGQGPGEFQRPWKIFAVGDSVVIIDQLAPVSVFGTDLRHVRTTLNRLVSEAGSVAPVSWPGLVAVAALDRRPDHAGYPLHFMDFSGPSVATVKSFGSDGVMLPEDVSRTRMASLGQRLDRAVAVSGTDAVFTVTKFTGYTIAKWDRSGELRWQLDRESDLFPRKETWTIGSLGAPPDFRIQAVWYDSRQYLWTYAHVAKSNWQQVQREFRERNPLPPPPVGGGRATMGLPASQMTPVHSLYDTIVEVIDVESRILLVSQRISGYVVDVLPDGRVLVYRETAEGFPFVDVVTVTRRGGH